MSENGQSTPLLDSTIVPTAHRFPLAIAHPIEPIRANGLVGKNDFIEQPVVAEFRLRIRD